MTAIRYGINKAVREPHKRKKILHENHTGKIQLPFGHPEFLERVIRLVRRKHPGWSLSGYAPKGPK